MKNSFFTACLLIASLLPGIRNLYAQNIPEMFVVGTAQFIENEFVSVSIRDENGNVCGGLKIVSNLDGLIFTAYNGVVRVDSSKPGENLVFVSPDERVLEVYKSGFMPLKVILSEYGLPRVESGKVWQLRITGDSGALLDTGKGDLTLETQPSGADIRIVGFPDFKEITPYTFSSYSARLYRFSLQKERYVSVDTLIVIQKDKKIALTIALTPITGLLSLTSTIPNTTFTVTDVQSNTVVYNAAGNPDRMVLTGDYRIDAAAPGYVKVSQTVRITENSRETVNIVFTDQQRTAFLATRALKRTIITKSLVIPGSGQRYAQYRGKGNLITTLQVLTVAGAVGAGVMARNAQNDYKDTQVAYKEVSNKDDAALYHDQLKKKYDDASTAFTIQTVVIGAALGIYLWNVIDALVIEPGGTVTSQKESMLIEPRLSSATPGVYVSLRF